jgi:hypothetical protein
MKSNRIFMVLFAAVMVLSFTCHVFGEEICLPKAEQKAACPPQTMGPILTDYATPIGKGKFAVQSYYMFNIANGAFTRNWQRVGAGGNYLGITGVYKAAYGITDRLEVYAIGQLIQNHANRVNVAGPGGERSASFFGIGDTNLTFKYLVVPETENTPAVSGIMGFNFPTGHFARLNPGRLGTDLLGRGSYGFTPGINVQKYLADVPVILYGNVWYTMNTDFTTHGVNPLGAPATIRNHPRDNLSLNLAAEFPIHKKFVPFVELNQVYDCGRMIGPRANTAPSARLSVMPGLQYIHNANLTFAVGVNVDLAGKNNRSGVTPMIAAQYAF